MAAGNWAEYASFKMNLAKQAMGTSLDTDDRFKVLLFKSTSNCYSELSATGVSTYGSLTNEVDSANNYGKGSTGGGLALSVSLVYSGNNVVWHAANVVQTATGGDITSIQFAVIAECLAGGTVSTTSKLVAAVSLSSAIFSITSTNTLTIDLSADLFDIT